MNENELHLLFSMIIPIPWLERVPSYKEKAEELGLDSYGFLGYPLLQELYLLDKLFFSFVCHIYTLNKKQPLL